MKRGVYLAGICLLGLVFISGGFLYFWLPAHALSANTTNVLNFAGSIENVTATQPNIISLDDPPDPLSINCAVILSPPTPIQKYIHDTYEIDPFSLSRIEYRAGKKDSNAEITIDGIKGYEGKLEIAGKKVIDIHWEISATATPPVVLEGELRGVNVDIVLEPSDHRPAIHIPAELQYRKTGITHGLFAEITDVKVHWEPLHLSP